MNTKHTAGPWSIGGPTEYVNQVAIDPAIGVLYGAGDELKANASLVIAAPKLLAALRLCLDFLEHYQDNYPSSEPERTQAAAAIALAIGEQTK